MYPDVCSWFEKFLQSKNKHGRIHVDDTSRKVLSRWLIEFGFSSLFPEYQTFEIEVDVAGVIERPGEAYLGFVECKLNRVTLRDLSQLLGYSKVAKPLYSFIVSPKGVSKSLNMLFNINRRDDVLYYTDNSYIVVGKWDEKRRELDLTSLIPRGHVL